MFSPLVSSSAKRIAITVNSARVIARSGANCPLPIPATMPRLPKVLTASAYHASGATSEKLTVMGTFLLSRRL